MPEVEIEWEIVKEAEPIIEKLCSVYADRLGHIDPARIGVAAITNKDRPESKEEDSAIGGVKNPDALFSTKNYVIRFYKNVWDDYTKAQRSAMLLRNLLRISEDMDGGLIKEDLKDQKCLVKGWGVDYMKNPSLPDFTESRQDLGPYASGSDDE